MNWLNQRKIDAHVHVLPGERAAQFIASEGPDAPWSRCGAGASRIAWKNIMSLLEKIRI